MTYALAKIVETEFWRQHRAAGDALKAIPGVGGGPMGLTPDAVRATPEYQAAKATERAAWTAARNHSGMMQKTYKKEIRADRDARRQQGVR